jgi:hypothetical protein
MTDTSFLIQLNRKKQKCMELDLEFYPEGETPKSIIEYDPEFIRIWALNVAHKTITKASILILYKDTDILKYNQEIHAFVKDLDPYKEKLFEKIIEYLKKKI